MGVPVGQRSVSFRAVQGDGIEAETLATVTCANCGRERNAGEVWRIFSTADAEAYAFCPACAEREFGIGEGE